MCIRDRDHTGQLVLISRVSGSRSSFPFNLTAISFMEVHPEEDKIFLSVNQVLLVYNMSDNAVEFDSDNGEYEVEVRDSEGGKVLVLDKLTVKKKLPDDRCFQIWQKRIYPTSINKTLIGIGLGCFVAIVITFVWCWRTQRTGRSKKTSILDEKGTSLVSQAVQKVGDYKSCLLYTSPSPRDGLLSRMPSSA
eukprot:TRINITY_DN791_c0_g1_i2.p1 TRINITY_DN791_c0_g1~~TRINITY_DN791_c0_g1_i2.p1  ORF type:complete len:192 (+),score=18.91 TRINITY_DN791_c0_g1_i2:65-640(+)